MTASKEGPHMDVLMITCPNTGRAVPPGIETDALSFASLPDVPTQTKCPVCGSVHVYDKRKALEHLNDVMD